MYTKRKEIMLIGDFNIDMLSENETLSGPSHHLTNFCDQFCLTNTITDPTRVTVSSKTLLDIILASLPDRFATSGTLRLGISDHDLIYIVRKQMLPKSKARIAEIRSFKNFDEEAFLSDVRAVPWDSAYVFEEIDDIWSHWENLFKNVVDIYAPIKRRSLRNNNLPWIDLSIQRQIRVRNCLYKLFRRLPTNENCIA